MNKVLAFLILIVFNVIGTTIAQAEVHLHEAPRDTLSSVYSFQDTGSHQDKHENHCDASHCGFHCHAPLVQMSSVDIHIPSNSFLLNFLERTLLLTEEFYEVIKPPLV